jgi:hypothetical protein
VSPRTKSSLSSPKDPSIREMDGILAPWSEGDLGTGKRETTRLCEVSASCWDAIHANDFGQNAKMNNLRMAFSLHVRNLCLSERIWCTVWYDIDHTIPVSEAAMERRCSSLEITPLQWCCAPRPLANTVFSSMVVPHSPKRLKTATRKDSRKLSNRCRCKWMSQSFSDGQLRWYFANSGSSATRPPSS